MPPSANILGSASDESVSTSVQRADESVQLCGETAGHVDIVQQRPLNATKVDSSSLRSFRGRCGTVNLIAKQMHLCVQIGSSFEKVKCPFIVLNRRVCFGLSCLGS